jgi:hypothetical protein
MKILIITFLFFSIVSLSIELTQIAQIASDDIALNNYFGVSVSVDGDYLAIGAQSNNGGNGAVYVFYWNGTIWEQQAKLTASIAESNNGFGQTVLIKDDVVITSDIFQTLGGASRGAVFIYEKPSGGWQDATETTIIQAADVQDFSTFGSSFDLHDNLLAIGRSGRNSGGSGRGAVYIYQKNGNTWIGATEEAILTPSGVANNLFMGFDVIINDDFVLASSVGYNSNAGGVYVFNKSGANWTSSTEDLVLEAGDAEASDRFGEQIAYNDGTLIVTASLENGAGTNRGAAYVFENDGNDWNETQSSIKLTASDAGDNHNMGIGLYLDNQTAFISSINNPGGGTTRGRVYTYRKDPNGWQSKTEDYSFIANNLSDNDQFGTDISGNSEFIVVGAWLSDEYFSDGGNAYVFEFLDTPFLDNFSLGVDKDDLLININADDNNLATEISFLYGTTSGIYSNTISNLAGINEGTGLANYSFEINNIPFFESPYFGILSANNSQGLTSSQEISFIIPLQDNDGVSDETENNAPNNGDGNGDGILDSEQASVASIFLESTGEFATIELISSCTELQNVSESNSEIGGNYQFPFGVLEFTIPCSTAEVKVYFHGVSDLTAYNYRKLRANGDWFNFTKVTYSQEVIDGQTVATATLQLTDGGPEDFDGVVNGFIHDPGGPALALPDASIPIWRWWHLALLGGVIGIWLWRKNA